MTGNLLTALSLSFRKDGTTVGSIGTGAGEIIVGRETTGLKFQHVTRQLIPRTTANASADAEIDLGSTSSRFKDLHLSGNVYANALRHDGDYNTYVAFLPDRIYMDRGGNRAFDADSGSTRFGRPDGSEAMRIDSSGRVGIGTSLPSAKATIEDGDFARLDLNLSNATGTTIADVRGLVQGTEKWRIGKTGSSSDDFAINVTGSEAMRIDSSGNVGIGTSSPDTLLNIASESAPTFRIENTDTTLSAGQVVGALEFFSSDPSGKGPNVTGYIETRAADAVGAGGEMVFATGATGGSPEGERAIERMRIDSSGRVGIGTSSPDTLLEVVGADPILTIRDTETSGASSNATLRLAESGASDTLNNYWDINHTGGSALRFVSKIGATTAERMRIDSSGNLLVGTTAQYGQGLSLNANATAYFRKAGDAPLTLRRDSTDGSILNLYKDGTAVGSIGAGNTRLYAGSYDTGISFAYDVDTIRPYNTTTGADRDNAINLGSSAARFKDLHLSGTAYVATDGVLSETAEAGSTFYFSNNNIGLKAYSYISSNRLIPCDENGANRDNYVDLGQSNARFNDIYATNGTIQTSDRNEKQDIAELSDAEQRVAVACKGLLRKFRWKSAVEEKGDEARIHFGIIAQDLQAAFAAEGLDAGDYGMFISTTWTDEETNEEKTRLGVRYSELLAFIISAL